MLPKNRVTEHPGELLREILSEMKIPQVTFAAHLGISLQRLNELINGKRGVTPETALLLGQAFEQSPEFWMNLQVAHDLTEARKKTPKIAKLKMRAA
jgi:antitoxin HigA-1